MSLSKYELTNKGLQRAKNYTANPVKISVINYSDEELTTKEDVEDIDYDLLKENNIKDEYYNLFNYKYGDKIIEIKRLLKNKLFYLPLLDNDNLFVDLYDFIKFNSFNYDKVIEEVNSYENDVYYDNSDSDNENDNEDNDIYSNYSMHNL